MGSVRKKTNRPYGVWLPADVVRNLTYQVEDGSDGVCVIVHVNLLYTFKTDTVSIVHEHDSSRKPAENYLVQPQRHLCGKREEVSVVHRSQDVRADIGSGDPFAEFRDA